MNCVICDRPTIHFHYNVASCKGCKTFFRRMVVSRDYHKERCDGDEDCFDLRKRASPLLYCRSCRFQKCLLVGMSVKTFDFEKTRFEKRKALMLGGPQEEHQLIELLADLEEKLEKFRISDYHPMFKDTDGLDVLLDGPSRLVEAERHGYMSSPFTTTATIHHDNSPLPSSGIRLLNNSLPSRKPGKKLWFFYNLLTTIEYIKTFSFFNQLNRADQLVLVKHVVLAIVNLHNSFFSVLNKFCTVILPDGSKEPLEDFSEVHFSTMVMSVSPLIRYQVKKVEYILLNAIFLCNPAIPNLSPHAQMLLSKHRLKFAEALRAHCLRARDASYFAELMAVFGVLERQQRTQKDLYLLHVAPIIAQFPKNTVVRITDDIMDS